MIADESFSTTQFKKREVVNWLSILSSSERYEIDTRFARKSISTAIS